MIFMRSLVHLESAIAFKSFLYFGRSNKSGKSRLVSHATTPEQIQPRGEYDETETSTSKVHVWRCFSQFSRATC